MWVILVLAVIAICLVFMRQGEDYTTEEIPRIIWTYWDSDEFPEIIQKSIENWKKYSPTFTVNVVTPSNIKKFLPEKDFSGFKADGLVQQRADLIRMYLLEKHGGIWSDASIAVRESHEWVIQEQKNRHFEFFAYYRKGSTKNETYPVIENWFFACVPHAMFMQRWRDEYERTVVFDDIKNYTDDLRDKGVDLQDIPDPNYLVPYASAQYVLQKLMTPEEIESTIYVLESDNGPFQHATENDWKPAESIKSLCTKELDTLPNVIKIYGNERRAIDDDESLKCSYKIFD